MTLLNGHSYNLDFGHDDDDDDDEGNNNNSLLSNLTKVGYMLCTLQPVCLHGWSWLLQLNCIIETIPCSSVQELFKALLVDYHDIGFYTADIFEGHSMQIKTKKSKLYSESRCSQLVFCGHFDMSSCQCILQLVNVVKLMQCRFPPPLWSLVHVFILKIWLPYSSALFLNKTVYLPVFGACHHKMSSV